MSKNEIIRLAQKIRNHYKTNNAIEICNKLGIKLNTTNLKPKIYPAYTTCICNIPIITLNEQYTNKSKMVLCAHELGHALMHTNKLINEFGDNHNGYCEYEANLFAVALLFNENDFCIKLSDMDNYLLKNLLDDNIHLK